MNNSDDFILMLYKQEYEKLFHAAHRMIGDSETAHDLVQDTFLLALSHQQKLSIHPNPQAWLMLTLRNLARNEQRLSTHNEISLETIIDWPMSNAEPSLEEMLPSQLSAEEKEILVWRFEQELDYREIACRLGISESGSRSRIFRIIAKCKKYFGSQ